MAKELLVDLLKRDKDMNKACIIYRPDGGEVTLTKEQTGCDKDQNVKVETDLLGYLKWYPILIHERLCLVGDMHFSDTISLRGKVGYEKGIACLQRYGKLFGNKELNAKGAALTRQEYDNLPRDLQKMFRDEFQWKYWLASKLKSKGGYFGREVIFHTIQYVSVPPFADSEPEPIEGWGLNGLYGLDGLDGIEMTGNFRIRPIIHLPDNVFVDYDSTENVTIKPAIHCYPTEKALKIFIG